VIGGNLLKQNIYDNPTFFEKYSSLRHSGATYNDFVEQPAIKSLISGLEGKSILDLGCGSGGFAKYCIDHGATNVVGVDISRNMINQARSKNKHENIEYVCIPIEDLDIPNVKFDLIISSLVVHYIEDYPALLNKVKALIHKKGEFIFSTEHPIVTAREQMNNWVKDQAGNKLHWALDHYHHEGKREQRWYIDGVIKYHRTISTLLNGLIEAGFTIEKILEPQAIPVGLQLMPKIINEKRRPSFIVIKAKLT
jgi:2-polyprenyl-3-methyl-5-hydroxy-6-metoxy-1,4-benzoquinol methylase